MLMKQQYEMSRIAFLKDKKIKLFEVQDLVRFTQELVCNQWALLFTITGLILFIITISLVSGLLVSGT